MRSDDLRSRMRQLLLGLVERRDVPNEVLVGIIGSMVRALDETPYAEAAAFEVYDSAKVVNWVADTLETAAGSGPDAAVVAGLFDHAGSEGKTLRVRGKILDALAQVVERDFARRDVLSVLDVVPPEDPEEDEEENGVRYEALTEVAGAIADAYDKAVGLPAPEDADDCGKLALSLASWADEFIDIEEVDDASSFIGENALNEMLELLKERGLYDRYMSCQGAEQTMLHRMAIAQALLTGGSLPDSHPDVSGRPMAPSGSSEPLPDGPIEYHLGRSGSLDSPKAIKPSGRTRTAPTAPPPRIVGDLQWSCVDARDDTLTTATGDSPDAATIRNMFFGSEEDEKDEIDDE